MRVGEHENRSVEIDAVFLNIGSILDRVPFKLLCVNTSVYTIGRPRKFLETLRFGEQRSFPLLDHDERRILRCMNPTNIIRLVS